MLYDRGLAAAIEWLARHFRDNHGLPVVTELAPAAEPADADVRAFLFQATRELLMNVVKHARASQARVTMTLDQQTVSIAVEDDGTGCDPGEAMRTDAADAGFGLFSLRERLRLLGSRLRVEPALGRGTRVSLSCPQPSEQSEQGGAFGLPRAEGERQVDGEAGERRRIRVMLVDDHRMMREGLAGILRHEADFVVVAGAADGREMIDQIEKAAPDVVVMDVAMPRMDGVEATRWLKQHQPHVRVIGLSMHEREDLAAAMLEAGAVTYLTKGGPMEDLITAVRQAGAPDPDVED